MRKMVRCWLLLLALILSLGACGEPDHRVQDLDVVRETGYLRVGVHDCAPYSTESQGQWSGFDVELATLVAEKLGVEVRFVKLDWDTRWQALEEGTVDCVWSCVTATDALAARVTLTQSYLASRPVLVTVPEKEKQVSFENTGIAAEGDSACALAAEACLGSVRLLKVTDQKTALESVLAGQADGAVVDLAVAQSCGKEGLVLRTELELGTQELKVALRKNSDLLEEINDALNQLQKEGRLDQLADAYRMKEWLVVG